MNNVTKVITCLYVGMFAINAQDIVFDGTSHQSEVLNFDITERASNITITKVKLNEELLQEEVKDITLIIPGRANGKQVHIGQEAFADLRSNKLQLKVKFETTEDLVTVYGDATYQNQKSTIRISKVQFPGDCYRMFWNAKAITEIDLSGVDSSNITNTHCMFALCNNLKWINFENFDTSNVTNMLNMFTDCSNLTALDLKNFNTEKVRDMSHMFANCQNLTELDLSRFDTKNVKNMNFMFTCCKNLKVLNLSNFDMGKVFAVAYMFYECENLEHLILSNKFTLVPRKDFIKGIFAGCKNLRDIQGLVCYTNNPNFG